MLRVGVDAPRADDADRGARETYASVLIVNDADREVNLNGVTVQFEFSKLIRLDDAASEFTTLGEFEFTCWGVADRRSERCAANRRLRRFKHPDE